MTITMLPTPHLLRRYSSGYIDSLGRFITMEAVYNNSTHDYDLTHGTAPERYDPSTGEWTLLAEDHAPYQDFGQLIDANDRIYRSGGQLLDNLTNAFTATFHVFDSVANSWSAVGPFPSGFGGRTQPASWVDPALGIFAGGGVSTSGTSQYQDMYLLSGGALTARAAPPVAVAGLNLPIDATGRVYLSNARNISGSLYRYDAALDSWFTTAAATVGVGGLATCIDQVQGLIYSMSIASGAMHFVVYNIATDTWSTLATFSVTGISNPVTSFLVFHPPTQAVYVYGIASGTNPPVGGDPNVRKYDPASDTWSATGDLVTLGYYIYAPAYDGTGYYVGQRALNNLIAQDAVNVIEYWVPAPLSTMGVGLGLDTAASIGARSFATIIGA